MGPLAMLFSPFPIGSLHLKNRILMAAMGNNLSHPQGIVSDQAIAYYRERARGGVGLIITEACPVSLAGRHRGQSICIYDDSFVPGLQLLTNAIHGQGSAIALQLHHAGRLAYPKSSGGLPLGPSPIPRAPGLRPPQELHWEKIQEIIDQFGIAARRAKAAGFDAVEIHGAHGYLIHQFLSPRTNQRKDEYGGNPQNRARFALEVLQRVRKEVGNFFPVIFRISVREFIPGEYSLEESLDLAAELEKSGASALHISGGTTESIPGLSHVIPPMEFPEAYHIPLASAVKKRVGLPLIAVGRLGNPTVAEEVLQEGRADLLALGRPLLSDPLWPAKVASGEKNRIRHCVACNYCIWRLSQQEKITCFQNASVAHEEEYKIQRAEKSRKIFIIGGGLAGLEAARVAKKRGHRVTLLEKSSALGGQMRLAHVPPHKQNLAKTLEWLIQEVKMEGVEIKLDHHWDAEEFEREKPDAVIAATGALPIRPENFMAPNVLTAWDVLGGKETGKNVLVLGGGMVGAETAEFLRQKGCQVTVVEMLETLASDMEATARELLLERIKSQGISVMLSTRVERIHKGRVLVNFHGEEKWLEAETVVLALGAQPERNILKDLEGKVPQILAVGDCVEPRRAKEAIHEGFLAALKI